MITAAGAASAYSSLAKLAQPMAAPGAARAAGPAGGSFGDMLSKAFSSATEHGKAADAGVMGALSGKGDLVDVVTAVTESEVALETLVSVRDKVIAAYEEIMRMPI
jgi:flagellar hook-basal body complex protein FliE